MQPFFQNIPDKKVQGIIIIPAPGVTAADAKNVMAKKYRHIDNTPHGISTFLCFAKQKYISATHVNFYTRPPKGQQVKGQFIDKIYLS